MVVIFKLAFETRHPAPIQAYEVKALVAQRLTLPLERLKLVYKGQAVSEKVLTTLKDGGKEPNFTFELTGARMPFKPCSIPLQIVYWWL